ncbi:MAG: serine/threonine-protein kinase [Ignavibacteriae bacterium]|nr:serine/threonine-protein kinase [Ignavibacteriota bacterium]
MEKTKMSINLTVIEGPLEGQEFNLTEHDVFTFGRAPDNRCYLDGDTYISRHHFLIEANPPDCTIKDLGSLNGTHINGNKIGGREKDELQEDAAKRSKEFEIKNGDLISIGHTEIKVKIDKERQKVIRSVINEIKKDNGIPDVPDYKIIRELGRGGMGIVYLAKQILNDNEVAVKVMSSKKFDPSEDEIKQFMREMQSCCMLNHKNIVAFLNQGYHNGLFYFVMEYCNGKSLFDLTKERGGNIPEREAVPIMIQVLEGLEYAHSKSLVHRDIKPENILLQRNRTGNIAKISDFGLAKNFQRAGLSGMTVSGAFAGSFYFMPKEQIINFRMAKPVTDVFSAGATFYYMLTGKYVYAFGEEEPIRHILEGRVMPLCNRSLRINKKLVEIIDKAIMPDANDRYQSVSLMKKELEKII